MISVAIGDLMRAEFTRLRDSHGSAMLPDEGATIEDWEQQTFLASGSLIARSCAAALTLARHSEAMQQKAFEFGKQIAFAYQVRISFSLKSCEFCAFLSLCARDNFLMN
jgi:decaprenyl-diphosphate synthase subunit 2